MSPVDVLALGAHPDDVELGCGGTLLLLVAAGRSVVAVDATAGEMATRGTPEQRASECRAATEALGIGERVNLGLPDGRVAVDDAATKALVAVLRRFRPRLFLAPLAADVHPDHVATGLLAQRAFFHAGLANYAADLGAPHRPRILLHYPGNNPIEPTFCVDISTVADAKAAAVRCYGSQVDLADAGHLVQGVDVLERSIVRDRFYGHRISVAAAEAFWADGPLPLHDLGSLIP